MSNNAANQVTAFDQTKNVINGFTSLSNIGKSTSSAERVSNLAGIVAAIMAFV